MKMTLDIDERKLSRIMALTGIRTKTAAVDFALDATERGARLRKLLARGVSGAELRGAVDPAHDISALRSREIPGMLRVGKRGTHVAR
jgi:hypothetical protein